MKTNSAPKPDSKPLTLRMPKQTRSREALERTYAATNVLLLDRPFDQISVAEIAATANVSVGSIYQRFSSKNDLLWTIYSHYLDEAEKKTQILSRTSVAQSIEEKTAALITVVCDIFRAHKGIVRSLMLKYRSMPQEIPDYYQDQINAVYSTFDKYLRTTGATMKRAIACRSLILAACREHILFDAFTAVPRLNSDKAFVQMLTPAALAVLHTQKD